MRPCLAVAACALGCGRLDFEPLATPSGPFGQPVPIAELNSAFDDDDPSLTADLLEMYFQSNREGAERLYRSTRARVGDPWSPPQPVVELDSGGDINNAKVVPDGLAIYFTSRRSPSAGGSDIWFSTRADRGAPWSPPQPIVELATMENDFEPWVGTSRLWIYFASRRGNATSAELWYASRASAGEPFGGATPLASLNTSAYDGGLWVDATERLALFQSERDGTNDLFQATRAARSDPFGAVEPLAELNTGASEQDAWLSADGLTLVFASNREGSEDLFIATR